MTLELDQSARTTLDETPTKQKGVDGNLRGIMKKIVKGRRGWEGGEGERRGYLGVLIRCFVLDWE